MNNDLQAVMARRRRVADGEKVDGENEMSIADLKAGGKGKSKKEKEKEKAEEAKAKANDLQAIMARRRRLADGEKEEKPEVKEPEKTEKPKEPKKDPLKEIMDRRRRIADGEPEPPPPPEPPKGPEPPKSPQPEKNSLQEIMQRRRRAAEAPPEELAPPEPPKPVEAPKSPEPEKGSLQEIMQRRRRVADGEIPPPPSPTRAPLSPSKSGDVEKLSLAPPNAGLSLAPPPSTRVSLAPPPRVATAVRADLKQVGMSSEVQKIMERRRKMAEVTNFVDEDEDSDDEDEDEDTPASSPKAVEKKPPPPPPQAQRSSFSPRRAAPQSVSSFSFPSGLPPMPSSPSRAKSSSTFSLKPAGAPESKPPTQATGTTFSLRPESKPPVQATGTSFSLRPGSKPPVQQATSFSLRPQSREPDPAPPQQTAGFSLKPKEPEPVPQPPEPEPVIEPEPEEEEEEVEEVSPPTPPPETVLRKEETPTKPVVSPAKPKDEESVSTASTPSKEQETAVAPAAPEFVEDDIETDEDEEIETDEEDPIPVEIPPPPVEIPPPPVEIPPPPVEIPPPPIEIPPPPVEIPPPPVEIPPTPVVKEEEPTPPPPPSITTPQTPPVVKEEEPSESASTPTPKLGSSSKPHHRKESPHTSAHDKHEKSAKNKKEKQIQSVAAAAIPEAEQPVVEETAEEKKRKKDKSKVEESPPHVPAEDVEPEVDEEPGVKAEADEEEDESEDEEEEEQSVEDAPVEQAPKEHDKPKPRKAARKKERRGSDDEEPAAETPEIPQPGKKQPKRKKRVGGKKSSSKANLALAEEEKPKPASKATTMEEEAPKPKPASKATTTEEEAPKPKPASKATTMEEEAPKQKPASKASTTEEEAPKQKPASKASTVEEEAPKQKPASKASTVEDEAPKSLSKSSASEREIPEEAPAKPPSTKQATQEAATVSKQPPSKQSSNHKDKPTEPSLASTLSSGRRKGGDEKSVTSAHSSSSAGDLSKGSLPTEDVSKAPLWDSRHEHPGGKADGKVSVFQRDGKGVAAQWSSEAETWVEIREVGSISNDDTPALASPGKMRRKKGVEGPGKQRRQKSRTKVSGDEGPRRQKSGRRLGSEDEGEEEYEEPEIEEDETPPLPPNRKKKATAVAAVDSSAAVGVDSSAAVGVDSSAVEGGIAASSSGFDASGWGDLPAFGSDNNASGGFGGGGADAFTTGFMADFGDAGFQGDGAAPVAFSTDAFRAESNFEDVFGSPSAFDPAAAGGLFAPAPQEPVYDITPLTKMPCTVPGKIELEQKKVMRCQFKGNASSNPLNGNVIFSCEARDGAILRELDTTRGNLQVLSTPILSPELSAKVANKYNATVRGLDEVIRIATGLHESNGLVRVRVAAILHLRVLETQQPLRVVAVWRWGHGYPHPVSLQYIVSPPSGGTGGDFSYEPSSMLVADNLLFLAGQSPKGPCVFISKPSLRESWTSNSLSGSGKVSSMEVLLTPDRSRPYLAVALTDKSISVWTYRSAVETNPGKEQQTKRWLFPLCRLDCSKLMSSIEASSTSADGTPTGSDAKSSGFCTHLSWLDSRSVGSTMLLIAASYQNGLAIFHVGLPVLNDKNGVRPVPEPTSGSSLSQTPRILPVVAKRWQGEHDRCMASWVDMGPYVNPCLSLLLQSSKSKVTRLVFGIISIPQFRRGPRAKEKVLPFKVLADGVLADKPPLFLLFGAGRGMIFCHSENHFYHISPFVPENSSGTSISSLRHPICSQPPGISSLGDPLLEETKTDKDGIVHVFSTIQFERNKADSDGAVFDWSRPTRRHWICRTVVGDTKSSSVDEAKEEKATSQFGDGETVLGGASTDIVCELCDDALAGSVPIRIVRSPGNDELYAILFRPSLCSKNGAKEGISLCATNVAFIDRSEAATVIRIVDARDAVFFPRSPGDPPRGVILSSDGLRLTFFTWDAKRLECKLHATYRPILGVEDDEDYIECKRIFVSAGASNVSLLAAGTRLRDLRTVVVSGELVEMTSFGPDDWTLLLPNIVTGRAAWLHSLEDVITLVGLEGDDSGYRNFSMVTSLRVIILSSAMEVAAECRTTMGESASLAPLGAFAVSFVTDGKVRYLCCLDGELSHGSIVSLPSCFNRSSPFLLLAVRQDRIIGTEEHCGIRLAELGQKVDSIFLPTASTRPAFLLEPLVANAVCIGGKQNQSTAILRNIIERFGRVVPLAHGENEGVGNLGSGLTSRVFQMLGYYGLKHAASWLLTGTVMFDRSANTTLLPAWLPVTSRTRGALNMDAVLHILSNGDQYLSDHVKNPDGGLTAALPRQSDPVSYLSRDLAAESLRQGRAIDALKTLDMVGSESAESMIIQLSLMLEKDGSKDTNGILSLISGYGEAGLGRSFGETRLPSSIAALVLSQKIARMRGVELVMNNGDIDRWMKPLAPSLQRGGRLRRPRQRLIGENDLLKAGEQKETLDDPLWTTACREAKHVWNEGPNREKSKLLMLDRIEDWVGRRRPVILGKEGASAARDRGALANILDMDENSFGGKSDIEDEHDGWVDGVGEGRTDEANLSGYFRFSEGDNEEKTWGTDGFLDLSPYQVKATLFGGPEGFSLQTSTSSVDEGEPGKVKSLYDIVFEKACAGALVLPAHRGGSLDVGVLHTQDRQSRQRCSIEFWYHISAGKLPSNEMVLARRTLGPSADDFSKVSALSDKDSMLWELSVKSSGEIVFRSCGGSSLRSTQKYEPAAAGSDGKKEQVRSDLVQLGKWNHVCLLLDSRGLGLTECTVSILMMGNTVAESKVSMLPSGFDEEDLDSSANLKELLQKSNILFGLNNPKEFRMTELRVWACTRSEDDINTFMREYLNAAEGKKKFKVKIKSKKGATTLGKGNLLTKGGMGGAANAPKGMLSLAPTPKMSLAPQKKEGAEVPEPKPASAETGFTADFNAFGVSESASGSPHGPHDVMEEEEVPMTLWDTALPLSQQVRSSAAAALIRGPPATRHFGGNRGGLPDFSGMERFGVGGVAICGSEKTIVWRDNEDPPALTYPIGASGAVVSDQMDDEGSEFLCCFLARDKRMVVFELQSRTVVVELQMTTKLNFWRFLPPEAGENTLCFMLVTPVGGFHWMPLDESPRPQQVWKRGPDLAGKKVVSYEEGGSNGLDGPDILSRVGLIMVTKASGAESLESWIVPIAGDSVAVQVSDDVMGGCFCLPPYVDEGPFLPLLVAVLQIEEGIFVNVMSLIEPQRGSVGLGEIAVTLEVDLAGFEDVDYEPPALAMGTFPEAICCSLANIVVVLIRRKGLIVAFELEDGDMSLIAREGVDHYVIDAVMRYSAEVGGAEIVMLLADDENPKDGRMVSFCFRSAA